MNIPKGFRISNSNDKFLGNWVRKFKRMQEINSRGCIFIWWGGSVMFL